MGKIQVSLKLDEVLLREVDKLVKERRFSTKTEAFTQALLSRTCKAEELKERIDAVREGTDGLLSTTEAVEEAHEEEDLVLTRTVALDASVIVKWFKKGEPHEELALKLRDGVLSGEVSAILAGWAPLEVMRALVKVGLPAEKVQSAYGALKDMANLGFVELILISELLDGDEEPEIKLNLYASDAVSLASPFKVGRCGY